MIKTYRFYKEPDNRWYIDLPEFIEMGIGTKDNLEMVAGADDLLSLLSDQGDEIFLEVTEEVPKDLWPSIRTKHPWNVLRKAVNNPAGVGATYIVDDEFVVWLCPVAEYIFGEYPFEIYYKIAGNE